MYETDLYLVDTRLPALHLSDKTVLLQVHSNLFCLCDRSI